MAGPESDRAWDEYEWERFLQQQDQKTEKYMELLEKYIDDPRRDEIVAQEMGWCQPGERNAEEWNEDADSLFDEELDEADVPSSNEQIKNCSESFEQHSLYRSAFSLTIWIDRLFEGNNALQNNVSAVRLATHRCLGQRQVGGCPER